MSESLTSLSPHLKKKGQRCQLPIFSLKIDLNNSSVCGWSGVGIEIVVAVYTADIKFYFKNVLVLFQKCPHIC
jgi:hypothetical protein